MTQEYVNTVTGPIRVEDLGVTLMHEHILIGYPGWEADTLRPGPGRAEMVDTAVDKIRSMQSIGIRSMLDPCPNDLGRDVGLAAIDVDKLFNPTHFHRNIIPALLVRGVSRAQIDTMLVDNPRRFFQGEV